MLVPDAVRLQPGERLRGIGLALRREPEHTRVVEDRRARGVGEVFPILERVARHLRIKRVGAVSHADDAARSPRRTARVARAIGVEQAHRSEEHTSELQSLMRISYAVFCLKKKKKEM